MSSVTSTASPSASCDARRHETLAAGALFFLKSGNRA
jgi:hypothetical protein